MTKAPERRPVPGKAPAARSPAPPPGLDLRALRIEASAGLLRAWAAQAVAGLLAGQAGNAAASGPLAELKLAAWHWRSLERPGNPIALLLASHLRAQQSWWRRWLPRRLARGLAHADPYWPPALWPAISTLAWSEPRFQRDTAEAVLEHFRSRVLMVEPEPTPVFRIQVWWLAVELVGVPALNRPPEKGGYRFLRRILGRRPATAVWRSWHRRGARGHLRSRLSAIAREEIFGAAGWAGFWEQWLVGEMMTRWPELVAEASSEARRILSVLPLLSEPPYRAVRNRVALAAPKEGRKSEERKLSVIVDPRWADRRPGVPPPGIPAPGQGPVPAPRH